MKVWRGRGGWVYGNTYTGEDGGRRVVEAQSSKQKNRDSASKLQIRIYVWAD